MEILKKGIFLAIYIHTHTKIVCLSDRFVIIDLLKCY